MDFSSANYPVIKAKAGNYQNTIDSVAIEEPLEIRVDYGPACNRTIKSISVTMRTPGNDPELATGFLFTEGIIDGSDALTKVSHYFIACSENKQNVILAEMCEGVIPVLQNTERNFYTTSSCGVCGKSSINAIKTVGKYNQTGLKGFQLNPEVLLRLPMLLRTNQAIFDTTGGLHGCAMFSSSGELLLLREDVGRHNALDKLIGAALNNGLLPLHLNILMLSGRASFELIQKAAMAGISIVAAVGAPSSLAIQLADEFGITLIGFLRQDRFNIYTHPDRISTICYEDTN